MAGRGPLGFARAAMNHQDDRIAPVLSVDLNPLIQASNTHEASFIQRSRSCIDRLGEQCDCKGL